MSRMLTLVQSGWSCVQDLARAGRSREALSGVKLLLARADFPLEFRTDAHKLAAELLLENEDYALARTHLRAARLDRPEDAGIHYLMGLAHETDPTGSDRKALASFRKSTAIAPADATYRAAFGRAAIHCDRVAVGLRSLLAAAELAPTDVDVIRTVVEGLIVAGKLGTAGRVVDRARFRQPANRELVRLGDRVRFETARRQQNKRRRQDAPLVTDGDSAFLPFIRRSDSVGSSGFRSGVIRRDAFSISAPHFARVRAER